ncbi:hypothetical protein SI65_05959 [Aspergillus cristatus]|uniref:Uncharacterized protein n=1 Tax=Aspergillus cristatus TaxID=573508 RepID=A0A1E3BEX8_ASPCR|nr:hypothetical protein SI65_05959 [Aspergillus cristatus]
MENYDPDLIPIQEFKILHTLATDPNASAPNAVRQVLNLTTTELSSKNTNDWPRNHFESDVAWNIGTLIIDIAANTEPVQQPKLLDFISRLQKVTVKDPKTGRRLSVGISDIFGRICRRLGCMLLIIVISLITNPTPQRN